MRLDLRLGQSVLKEKIAKCVRNERENKNEMASRAMKVREKRNNISACSEGEKASFSYRIVGQ